jgi:hypothetical protein
MKFSHFIFVEHRKPLSGNIPDPIHCYIAHRRLPAPNLPNYRVIIYYNNLLLPQTVEFPIAKLSTQQASINVSHQTKTI